MYVPVNEDDVHFGKNDFTDGNDFQNEDGTVDDYEKNDEIIIDNKYLDDEELSKPQTIANLQFVFGKVDKLSALWDYGGADASLAIYIPGLTDVTMQGQLYSINAKKAYAAQILAANTYTNYSSMCVVLPM